MKIHGLLPFAILLIIHILTPLRAACEGRLFRPVHSSDNTMAESLTVYDITRSRDGFTWLATDHGLLRFDGEYAVSIDGGLDLLKGEPVKSLAPVGDKGLLAGTPHGVCVLRYDEGRYAATPLLGGKKFTSTSAVAIGSTRAATAGDAGILIYDETTDSVRQIRMSHDVLDLSNNVIDMAYEKGHVYVLTKGGVYDIEIEGEQERIKRFNHDIASFGEHPAAIAVAQGKLFIAGMDGSIHRISLHNNEKASVFPALKGRVVTSLEVSADGETLYIGTDGSGVVKASVKDETITGEIRHASIDPSGPRSNQIYSLFTDDKGELWMGYYQGGADYTPTKEGPFTLIDNPHTFNTRGVAVRALCLTGEHIVIGTREGVVIFDTALRTAHQVRSPQLRSEMVISLMNHEGKVYAGTYGGGLQTLDPRSGRIIHTAQVPDDDVFVKGNIFSLAVDKGGDIWVGTNKGLYRINATGGYDHYTSTNSALPEGNVYGIFFDSQEKGWICTEKGLAIYDPRRKTLRTDLFPSSFPKDKRFRTVYEDRSGRLYFVPEWGHVLTCKADFSDERLLDMSFLSDTDAKGVVEDKSGNIWVATNNGLFRIDKDGSVLRFGTSSGLPSAGFLQGQPQIDGNSDIWFGNSEGLVKLSDNEISDYLTPPGIPVPTLARGDGELLVSYPFRKSGEDEYVLTLDEYYNSIKICFSTLSYALEDPVDFEYSIDGDEWVRFRKELCVSLYSLSPGSHTLHVRSAKDTDGASGITTVKINVPYPWHWWVIFILIGVVVALICVALYRHLRRRARKGAAAIAGQNISQPFENPAAEEMVKQEEKRKYVSNNLSRNEAREIGHKMDEVMQSAKPYLNPDLKLTNLADMVGVSGHKLSQFFSQHKGKTFYDYINGYRIDEFKRIVKEDEGRNYTLSAMAEKAGFSSRASFFRYFKNVEGLSPGEYLKNLKKE